MISIAMFRAAKKVTSGLNALAFGQMYAAMCATHHILGKFFILLGFILVIKPDQQINHSRNGNQQ